ncbi:MAG: recombination protein NinG [Aeromonadaceae bacterium]
MSNSSRRCKRCLQYHSAESGVKLPAGWFCTMDHAIEFAREKSARSKERKAKADHRQRKMDVKPIGYWAERAQRSFNAYIRARDANEPCICCGACHDGQWHAGHYRSVGGHPELRFEEDNCHKQASYCNNYKSGNLAEYRIRLIAKIGLGRVEWLEGRHEPKRYRREDYQAIEAEYKAKLKELIGS